MAKGSAQPKGLMQRQIDREIAAREAEPLVSPFAEQHGDYAREPMPVTTGELGAARAGNVQVTRNRGGSTLQRWINAEQLTQSQIDAIVLYSKAWHTIHSMPRTTANWSLVAFIRGQGAERRIVDMIDAEELLKLLDNRVFEIAPRYYFDVWQNIILFDQPAGVAGGNPKTSGDRAKTIVLFIADMIATILRL
jgi:hypothetical protein